MPRKKLTDKRVRNEKRKRLSKFKKNDMKTSSFYDRVVSYEDIELLTYAIFKNGKKRKFTDTLFRRVVIIQLFFNLFFMI